MLARHLNNIFDITSLKQEPTRDGFGHGLVDSGKSDERIVALCADLSESTRTEWFQKEFPSRYIEVGVAEQNLATIASGMANYGKIPFIMSYAVFSPGRNNEQIRTKICINKVPVKIIGCHSGVSVGPDGATHQALEDIGLMRMLPNMIVVVPCDSVEAYKATTAIAHDDVMPSYLRLGRASTPVLTTEKTHFEIGKAQLFYEVEKSEVTIIACGAMVYHALCAAKKLEGEIAVNVMNLATIKPLDTESILKEAEKSGAIVTVEEHQIAGGMGSAVAEFLAQTYTVPIEFIGVHDRFGQSGTPEELYKEYGLDATSIIQAVRKVVRRK